MLYKHHHNRTPQSALNSCKGNKNTHLHDWCAQGHLEDLLHVWSQRLHALATTHPIHFAIHSSA
jgi:hypothetical protein